MEIIISFIGGRLLLEFSDSRKLQGVAQFVTGNCFMIPFWQENLIVCLDVITYIRKLIGQLCYQGMLICARILGSINSV